MQQLEEAANTAQRNGADEGKRILRRDPCITSWIFLEGDDGESIFEQACKMGLEGIVSKRRDFPYRSGRTKKLDENQKFWFGSGDAKPGWDVVRL